MNTSVMHPFPLLSPYPSIPFQGKQNLCKATPPSVGTWEAAPHRVICVASKIFHSSAQIASVIQIKAEGEEEALVPGIP